MESIAYLSVNVFVLITGYFQSSSSFKWKKVVDLIIQITFWSVVCYFVTIATGTESFSVQQMIKVVLPWLFGEYWFPTVYLGLYVLSPYLNRLISSLDKKEYQIFILTGTVLCCFPFLQTSVKMGGGMSLFWFCHLYITAGYLRKYVMNVDKWIPTLALILCILLLWLPNIMGLQVLGYLKSYEWSYNSLPTYVGAVAMLMLFANTKVKTQNRKDTIICNIAGLTFGVFLIHDNIHLRVWLWDRIAVFMPQDGFAMGSLWMVLVVIIGVFMTCAILELIRQSIFKAAKNTFHRVA
jgi:surface polysaccharide O-acyltransferase-like enzyme